MPGRGLLGDAVGVAVNASYEVNVVWTRKVLERGVHTLHYNAAIGKARVAGAAGRARLLAVFEVAREAAEPFVHTDGCAVIAGMHLSRGSGRMALIAQSLALVRANRNHARPV